MDRRREYELYRTNTQLPSKKPHISIPEFDKMTNYESGRRQKFESNPEKVQRSPSRLQQADWKKERQRMFENEPALHTPKTHRSGTTSLEKTISTRGRPAPRIHTAAKSSGETRQIIEEIQNLVLHEHWEECKHMDESKKLLRSKISDLKENQLQLNLKANSQIAAIEEELQRLDTVLAQSKEIYSETSRSPAFQLVGDMERLQIELHKKQALEVEEDRRILNELRRRERVVEERMHLFKNKTEECSLLKLRVQMLNAELRRKDRRLQKIKRINDRSKHRGSISYETDPAAKQAKALMEKNAELVKNINFVSKHRESLGEQYSSSIRKNKTLQEVGCKLLAAAKAMIKSDQFLPESASSITLAPLQSQIKTMESVLKISL